jgi:Flp pilus assembly protein TadG
MTSMLRRLRRRLVADQSGATAVEFALVALPFICLLIAIIETALLFFAQQCLQAAAQQSARLIQTGQAQQQGMTAAQFHTAVCNAAGSMFNCSGLYVNVQTFASFSAINTPGTLKNGKLNTSTTYVTGTSGDIVLVQVFYDWPVISLPGMNLANNGSYTVIQSTIVFRNEPYGTN